MVEAYPGLLSATPKRGRVYDTLPQNDIVELKSKEQNERTIGNEATRLNRNEYARLYLDSELGDINEIVSSLEQEADTLPDQERQKAKARINGPASNIFDKVNAFMAARGFYPAIIKASISKEITRTSNRASANMPLQRVSST